MTKIQQQVEVAKKYKIESSGYGVPFPQKIESVHKANSNLMGFAFSFFGNKEKYFYKFSEEGSI